MTYLIGQFRRTVDVAVRNTDDVVTCTVGTGIAVVEELDRLQEIEEKYNLLLEPSNNPKQPSDEKMTLRDQIAIAVLNGLLSGKYNATVNECVVHCYAVADAMLKQRKLTQ